jgi:predicted RNase H-like HicB family nuclease
MAKVDTVHQVTVVFARDANGGYVALVRGLRGCQALDQTLEQAMQRIREAVALSLAAEPSRPTLPGPGFEWRGAQQLAFPA